MKLESVSYANRDSLSTLLAACPFLQDLTLKLSAFGVLKLLNYMNKDRPGVDAIILIPTLKRLRLYWPMTCRPYKVHINTPALEYFHFTGVLNKDFVLEKLPNVVESVVEVVQFVGCADYAKKVWDFMGQFCNVKSMELMTTITEVIASYYFFFFFNAKYYLIILSRVNCDFVQLSLSFSCRSFPVLLIVMIFPCIIICLP